MGNWTVKLKILGGFFRLGDWSVDWVEIIIDEPDITVRCNVNALLDPKLTDALNSKAIRETEKTSIGGSCQRKGNIFCGLKKYISRSDNTICIK